MNNNYKELLTYGLDASIMEENNVILSVRHLKQYFRFGTGENKYNKAVHDVSFDIHKGEVFGLVGESGCGKTTTGRSIIKLYDITSGSVYFEGQRISAGTRWNEKEIKWKTKKANQKISELNLQRKEELKEKVNDAEDSLDKENIIKRINEEYDFKINKIKNETEEIVKTQHQKIKEAHYDNRNCDKIFVKNQIASVNKKYDEIFKSYGDNNNIPEEVKDNYKKELKEAKHTKLTSKIQMIFQDPIASLDPRMTVREIIAEGLKIQGIRKKEIIDKKVNDVLTLVGLVPEHASRYPHEFSGGQRQRIGIARAIVMNPDLIIADEPVSALDVSIQAQVINLLNDLRKNLNLTILFVAHDLSVVKYFCDKIAVMYFGKIVELASSDELFLHPLHPYTKALLSAIPIPDPHFEKQHKRIIYNPITDHDYSKEKSKLIEIIPGHFVDCNTEEKEKYLKEIGL